MKKSVSKILIIPALMVFMLVGCRGGGGSSVAGGDGVSNYNFSDPVPISGTGSLDIPRLAYEPGSDSVHMVYLMQEGPNQKVMYTRMEDGEFRNPTSLSQHSGQKRGGAFLGSFERDEVIAYWINVPATSGQLRYKISNDGGQVFSWEARWNERNEARWPCVMKLNDIYNAYFFIHYLDTWELVVNRDFSADDEQRIDTAQGSPFHLQGFTNGNEMVWLAYFVRRQGAEDGRIAFLTSSDSGLSFTRQYLFDDRLIRSLTGFFKIERSEIGDDSFIHLMFVEATEEFRTLYYSRSEDDGQNFTTPVQIFASENPLTEAPVLLSNGQYVFIATADADEDGPALRYVVSGDAGESFAGSAVAIRNISNPETIAGVIDEVGSVVLVWDDLATGSSDGEQLYFITGELLRD